MLFVHIQKTLSYSNEESIIHTEPKNKNKNRPSLQNTTNSLLIKTNEERDNQEYIHDCVAANFPTADFFCSSK
jgi:hypothetical protein